MMIIIFYCRSHHCRSWKRRGLKCSMKNILIPSKDNLGQTWAKFAKYTNYSLKLWPEYKYDIIIRSNFDICFCFWKLLAERKLWASTQNSTFKNQHKIVNEEPGWKVKQTRNLVMDEDTICIKILWWILVL